MVKANSNLVAKKGANVKKSIKKPVAGKPQKNLVNAVAASHVVGNKKIKKEVKQPESSEDEQSDVEQSDVDSEVENEEVETSSPGKCACSILRLCTHWC